MSIVVMHLIFCFGDVPNILFWFKPGQRKRCDNCDGTNQFDSFLISNFTIRPVGYVFVYVMHGSKIKKILTNFLIVLQEELVAKSSTLVGFHSAINA